MIGAYLNTLVTNKTYKGADKHQTPLPRTNVAVKARIEYSSRQVEDTEGRVIVSTAKVLMRDREIIDHDYATRETLTISYQDILNFNGRDHTIIQIIRAQDFSTRFMTVYVK